MTQNAELVPSPSKDTMQDPVAPSVQTEDSKATKKQRNPKRNKEERRGDGESPQEAGGAASKKQRSEKTKKGEGEQLAHQKKPKTARPHRRLDIGVISSRLEKLKRRIHRARNQLEDAQRHADGYERELQFRSTTEEPDDGNTQSRADLEERGGRDAADLGTSA